MHKFLFILYTLRVFDSKWQSLLKCLPNYLKCYYVTMQTPPETIWSTSKVHVKSSSEGRERSVSANVLLEAADTRASPRPLAVGERMCALNGELCVVRLATDTCAAAPAPAPASRLEQLSARVSYLEAELASRQRQFDDERAIWLLEKDKVRTLS